MATAGNHSQRERLDHFILFCCRDPYRRGRGRIRHHDQSAEVRSQRRDHEHIGLHRFSGRYADLDPQPAVQQPAQVRVSERGVGSQPGAAGRITPVSVAAGENEN